MLLNDALELVATLPYLCDVFDGQLYFDDGAGNVRKAPIYAREELIDLAKQYDS